MAQIAQPQPLVRSYRVIFADGGEWHVHARERLPVIDRYNGFWRATAAELADRLFAGAVLFSGTDRLENRFVIAGRLVRDVTLGPPPDRKAAS